MIYPVKPRTSIRLFIFTAKAEHAARKTLPPDREIRRKVIFVQSARRLAAQLDPAPMNPRHYY
jgi:hypothetical protein